MNVSKQNDNTELSFFEEHSFFVTFTFLLFDSGVWLPFNIGNELNFKKISSQRAKKVILSLNKF